jgi:glycosyltransferase involved in cell wall biosynthesis
MTETSVIHLTPHFYWPQLEKTGWPVKFDTMGGMQNQIFRQVNFLDKSNVKQLVITLKIPEIPSEYKISDNLTVVSKRIPIIPIRSRIRGMVDLNISWFLGVFFYIINNKKKLKSRYKIIHAHCSGVGMPLLAGYLASNLLGLPLITSIHCSAISTYKPMSFLDRYLHRLNILIEKFVLSKARSVIFLTQDSMNECAKYVSGLINKSSVITDSIDSDYFSKLGSHYSKNDFIAQYNIPMKRPICIYVGRIAREKGWRDIVNLAKELSEKYHFLIVGDGNEFDLMKEMIAKNNLENNFSLTGYISQDKVPTAMSLAKILVLPSRHEEFGSVLLESMTMGLISIAYNVGGVPNVISHRDNGLLASNYEDMKTYMEEILKDPILQKNIQTNSRKTVKEKFQLHNRGNEILNIYNKIIYENE